MAIDFGNTIMDGGIQPSVQVQAPVEDNSGAILARGLAPVAETIGGIAGSIFQANQKDASAKILTGYENELLDLADSVDQGMDKNEAMIRARALRRQYLANSPALQQDFDKIWSNFAGSNGLGSVVVQGTVDQQIEQARYEEARKLGYTPEQYDQFQAVSRQATALNQQLEIVRSQGGIVTETMKNQSIQVMTGLADKAFPAAQAQINEAMAQIEANPSQKAEIAAATINNIKTSVAQLEHMTGGVGAEYISTPINNLLATFTEWSNGGVETSVLEGQVKNTQAKYDAMYALDPTLGPVIAQSKLLNELGLSQSPIAINAFDADVIRRLKEVSDQSYTLNILGQQPGDQKMVQMLNEAASVNLSDDAQKEVADIYAQIIDGAYVHERSTDDPLGYKDTIEALGSIEATEFFRNNPVNARHADKFADVIAANYQEAFLPAVTQYWTTSTVQIPAGFGQNPTSQQVVPSQVFDPVWNGSAVEFVLKPEYQGNEGLAQMQKDINTGDSSIGVPLNNLIRAIANVSGQDAKAVWESQFAGRVFNIGEEGQQDTTSASPLQGSSLTILGNPPGLQEQGNIDLNARSVVQNEDGSISTEESMSFNDEGVEVLIPTVFDGAHHTQDEAIQHYYDTGEHLGKFATPEQADQYADFLHNRQDSVYNRQEQQDPNGSLVNVENGMTPEMLNANPSGLTLDNFNPDPEVAFEAAKKTVENTSASNATAVVNANNPIEFAEGFMGLTETNREDVQVLSSFIQKTAGISINPAQTAWCAAFVDAILHASGQGPGTGKLNARSYLNWGQAVDTPQQGDVVVMWRGDPNGQQGHVGFYAGTTPNGKIRVLGGNQGDSVSISEYDPNRVLGYRRANNV